jgi:hypothetical protein
MSQVKISRGQVSFSDMKLGQRFFYDRKVYVKMTMVPQPEQHLRQGYSNARSWDNGMYVQFGCDTLVHPAVEDEYAVTY